MKKYTGGEIAEAIANFLENCDELTLANIANIAFPDADVRFDLDEHDFSVENPEAIFGED